MPGKGKLVARISRLSLAFILTCWTWPVLVVVSLVLPARARKKLGIALRECMQAIVEE